MSPRKQRAISASADSARLARLETAFLLQELRPYLHNFELTGPVVRLQSNFVNGIKKFPVTVSQR